MTFGNPLIACHRHRTVIVHTVGQFLHFAVQVCTVYHAGTMPYTDKVQALGIIVPAIVVYTRFETLGNISLLFAAQIHHTKAVSVTFISVALHALPCDVLAVG